MALLPKTKTYIPPAEIVAAFPKQSGNVTNGLNESRPRRASPFFWHPPDRQTHGDLQKIVLKYIMGEPEVGAEFMHSVRGGPERGPEAVELAEKIESENVEFLTEQIKSFALDNEADFVGITTMKDDYLFEGYDVDHKYIIVIGVAHSYDEMKTAPATTTDTRSAVEVARQYNRGARVVAHLRNFILELGFPAQDYPGPLADAINMIPAALDCGFGELGKHGSIINRRMGSSFRLAAVTTNLPLLIDSADHFGVDDICQNCRICEDVCPPKAILPDKKLVRGVEKWYVDFDKCIPFFAESFGCGVCVVACPWSRPGIADNLLLKLARRQERQT